MEIQATQRLKVHFMANALKNEKQATRSTLTRKVKRISVNLITSRMSIKSITVQIKRVATLESFQANRPMVNQWI